MEGSAWLLQGLILTRLQRVTGGHKVSAFISTGRDEKASPAN